MLTLALFELCVEHDYHLAMLQHLGWRSPLVIKAAIGPPTDEAGLLLGMAAQLHNLVHCLLPFDSLFDLLSFLDDLPSHFLVFVRRSLGVL